MTTTGFRLWAAAALGLWLHAAFAHEVADPKFGGIVAAASHLDFELVFQGDTVILYVEDHGDPVPTEGGRAKLILSEGNQETEAELSPVAPNSFVGKGLTIRRGSAVSAVVTLPGPRVVTVRF